MTAKAKVVGPETRLTKQDRNYWPEPPFLVYMENGEVLMVMRFLSHNSMSETQVDLVAARPVFPITENFGCTRLEQVGSLEILHGEVRLSNA